MNRDNSPAPPLPLVTARQMQEWDHRAITELGVPERVLMESAGRAAARIVHALFPRGRVGAAVGRGNNGGDAVVLLRSLRSWGREAIAVPVGADALPAELLHGWEIPVAKEADAVSVFRDCAVVVDGLLGTGASGPPRPPQAECIRAMHAAGRPVVALDGPTGVDLTRGTVEGEAVRAECTITFGAPKRGLLLHPGRVHAGRIFVVETGFPPLRAEAVGAGVITAEWAASRWKRLPPDAHKGVAGRLIVLAGHNAVGGAPIMCGHAALRTGAGTVRIVSHAGIRVAVAAAIPEALFSDREVDDVAELARTASALVAGPGIGTDEAARVILARMLEAAECPVLLDADALTLLASDQTLLPERLRDRTLLTPHPGEMGRLLGIQTHEVTADAFGAVEAARDRFGCTVLLKGAPTLVAAPGAPVLANITGHSGVGVGGMGDTLAGLIGALMARGLPPADAAGLGIYYAGAAADRLGRGRPILPRDVAEMLPNVLGQSVEVGGLDFPEILLELEEAV
ncbi:MAG TPA: NAD(P)H-hydrate dehydratase [Longimicrobiaceae bacterium]